MKIRVSALLCLGVAIAGAAGLAMGCHTVRQGTAPGAPVKAASGRITVRPTMPTESCKPGLHALGLGGERDGVLFIPAAAIPTSIPTSANNGQTWGSKGIKPMPLVVLLHGAGGGGRKVMGLMQTQAERDGFLVLAPDSRRSTWDAIHGAFGPDVEFLNSALGRVFAQCAVDPARIAVGGFSDGATYALGLGLNNGDLFTRVLAFSPGFMVEAGRHGRPEIFVSHGRRDRVLPIDQCSRLLVPAIEREGYRVRYREFDGPHGVPAEIVEEATKWWIGR